MCPGRTTSPLPFFSPKNLGFESRPLFDEPPCFFDANLAKMAFTPAFHVPSLAALALAPEVDAVALASSPPRSLPVAAPARATVPTVTAVRRSMRRATTHDLSHALAPSSRRPRSSSRRRRRLPRARRSVPPTSRRVDRSFSNTSFSRFLEYDTRDHTIATTYHVLFKNSSMRGFRTAKFYVKNDRTHGTSTSNRSFGQTRRGIDGESTPHDATRARTRCKFS